MRTIGITLAATALVLGGASAASAQADATTCQSRDLSIAVGAVDPAAGSTYREILFTNRGTDTCVLRGFPGVSYVNSDGQQVGKPAERVGARGPLVTLPRGATAVSVVRFTSADAFDPAACDVTPVWGVRVYPPDAVDPLYLGLFGQRGCAGDVDQLTVATVQSWS